jgi:hypothetical protein
MEKNFVLIPFFLILGFVFLIGFMFSKKVIVKRNLKKYRVKPIADFKEGERSRIIGKVVYVGKPLQAPLSGRTCSHYYAHVEEKGNDSWTTCMEEEKSCNVVLQDGDYYALIKHANLKSYIVQDQKYSSGTFNDATPLLERYLKKHGHDAKGLLGFNKQLRYSEGILEEGERVTVAGLGEWKQAEDVGLPASYGRVLVMHGGNDSLYLTDARDIVNQK